MPKKMRFGEFGKQLQILREAGPIRDPSAFCREFEGERKGGVGISRETLRKWEVGERLPGRDKLHEFLEITQASTRDTGRMKEWRNELASERDGSQAAKFLSPNQVDKVVAEIVKYVVDLCEENDLEMPVGVKLEVKQDIRHMISKELGPT